MALTKEEILAKRRAHYEANRERLLATKKERYVVNRDKILAQQKKYQDAHKELVSTRNKEYREIHKPELQKRCREYYHANKEKLLPIMRGYYQNNRETQLKQKKEYYEANKDSILEKVSFRYDVKKGEILLKISEYQKKNLLRDRPKKAAKTQRHRAAKMKRTPAWLTESDIWMMQEIYELAELRTRLTGISWHVDHIIPLQGKIVSGLHVPTNLQVIPAAINLSKGNSYGHF